MGPRSGSVHGLRGIKFVGLAWMRRGKTYICSPIFARQGRISADKQDETELHANHSTVDPQGTQGPYIQEQIGCLGRMPAAPWCMHQGVHHYAEEAELGASEGGQGAALEQDGGDRLHRW